MCDPHHFLAAMACSRFTPQFYRPYLCSSCFQTIAKHGDDWEEVTDAATGDVRFVQRGTGRVLLRTGGDRASSTAAAASSGGWGAVRAPVPMTAAFFDEFARRHGQLEFTPPPGSRQAARVRTRTGSRGQSPMLPPSLPPAAATASASATTASHASSSSSELPANPALSTLVLDSAASPPEAATASDSTPSAQVEKDDTPAVPRSTAESIADETSPPSVPAPDLLDDALSPSSAPQLPVLSVPLPADTEQVNHGDERVPSPVSPPPSTPRTPSAQSSTRSIVPAPEVRPTAEAMIDVDPTTVALDQLLTLSASDRGGGGDVLSMAVTEVLDDGLSRTVHLVVTDSTVLALEAHPSRLGWAVVLWERSLASLQFVAVQSMAAEASRHTDASRSSAAARRPSLLASLATRVGLRSTASASSQPSSTASTSTSSAAVGILLSFKEESAVSLPLLRVVRFRAPRLNPVQGLLLKRPAARAASTAWRERRCALAEARLDYFAPTSGDMRASASGVRGSSTGGSVGMAAAAPWAKPKGSILLSAPWVMVSEVTEVDRRGWVFRLRTPTTFHEFALPSEESRAQWMRAIRTHLLHLAAARPCVNTLICPSLEQAEAFAAAVEARRVALRLDRVAGDANVAAVADAVNRSPHLRASTADDDSSMALALRLQAEDGSQLPRRSSSESEGHGHFAALRDGHDSDSDDPDLAGVNDPDMRAAIRASKRELTSVPSASAAGVGATPPLRASAAIPPMGVSPMDIGGARRPIYAPESGMLAMWTYVDDFDRVQGPFLEPLMRSWVMAGFFGPETLVSCTSVGIPGLDITAGAQADGSCMFQPLGTLFASPHLAFDGSLDWVPSYNHSAQYQSLVSMAMSIGVDGGAATAAVARMRAEQLPADLSLLLDLIAQPS